MRCKHENADHLMPGQSSADLDNQRTIIAPVLVEQFRCLDCGEWLSLGHSDEYGCESEIRAAELAASAVIRANVEVG